MVQGLLTMDEPEEASTCRTSSSSIVSSNEDLMHNILSRLPVKALSRFKCVSKHWNMLISDPYFVSSHQARATQDLNMMKVLWVNQDGLIRLCSIEEKEEKIATLDLIQPSYPDEFLLQGPVMMAGRPCNGLICLTAGVETLVCNPATRHTMLIPKGNRSKYNYVQGLGFCSSSNEFKVIRLFVRPDLGTHVPEHGQWYGCELFTVGQRGVWEANLLQHSRSWRHVGNLPYRIVAPVVRKWCCVNGRVHWIIKSAQQGNPSSSEFILSLDLEHEEFKVISRPEHWAEDARSNFEVHLKELGGELCVGVTKGVHRQQWDIWVLKDYSNSIWSKDYHINIEGYHSIYSFSVVAMSSRGRLLLEINNRAFYYYDTRNNFLEKVMEVEGLCFLPWKLGTYVESLVIPF